MSNKRNQGFGICSESQGTELGTKCSDPNNPQSIFTNKREPQEDPALFGERVAKELVNKHWHILQQAFEGMTSKRR